MKEKLNQHIPLIIEKFGYFLNPFLLNFTKENNHLLIFYFHGIFEDMMQKNLNHIDPQNNMTASQFIDFIDYFLNHKYIFIRLEDVLGGLQKDKRYAMITFDDGYFNNVLAIEILTKYRIPAVFFITTKNIMENKSFWWDILYKYRIKQGNSLLAIENEQSYLKRFKNTYIDKYIKHNFGTKSIAPWSDIDRPFTESELKHIAKNPFVSIGNHTHSHSILINYNKEEIQQEFFISNKILFDLTGTVPIAISFPNGNYNKLVLALTENIGFRIALTTEAKKIVLPIQNGNLICLGRFMTTPTNIKNNGSFYRIGYTPYTLYSNLTSRSKSFLKILKELGRQ